MELDDENDPDADNLRMGDDSLSDNSSDMGLSKGSVTRKLSKIEKKISRGDLSKRERRLLQNRKSALKCRLKKQDQLERLKSLVDRLSGENRSLKEKVSSSSSFDYLVLLILNDYVDHVLIFNICISTLLIELICRFRP